MLTPLTDCKTLVCFILQLGITAFQMTAALACKFMALCAPVDHYTAKGVLLLIIAQWQAL